MQYAPDRLLDDVWQFLKDKKDITLASIQREFKIGHFRARDIVDELISKEILDRNFVLKYKKQKPTDLLHEYLGDFKNIHPTHTDETAIISFFIYQLKHLGNVPVSKIGKLMWNTKEETQGYLTLAEKVNDKTRSNRTSIVKNLAEILH